MCRGGPGRGRYRYSFRCRYAAIADTATTETARAEIRFLQTLSARLFWYPAGKDVDLIGVPCARGRARLIASPTTLVAGDVKRNLEPTLLKLHRAYHFPSCLTKDHRAAG